MDAVIGLDLGTSAIKGVILDSHGQVLASHSLGTRLESTGGGRIEFDAEECYRSVTALIGELNTQAPAGTTVRAISAAAASGNALVTGPDGRPRIKAISWMDRRTVGMTQEILPDLNTGNVHSVTGWPWREGFAFAQFAALKRFRPGVFESGARLCMFSDYVTWRLGGNWVIDNSTATPSLLQHQESMTWHSQYLSMLDTEPERLSTIVRSGEIAGTLTGPAARECGIGGDVAVVAGCFDHPAAARAVGVTKPEDILLSCGTSWVGLVPVSRRHTAIEAGLLVDPFLWPSGPLAGMTSLSRIGAGLDRVLDTVVLKGGTAGRGRYAEFDRLAATVAPQACTMIIDPMSFIHATGADCPGKIEEQPREVIARALMEGAAFCLRERLDRLSSMGIGPKRARLAGGPADSPIWPGIIADITGLPLEIVHGRHTGAIGAARIAGRAVGIFSDRGESPDTAGIGHTIYPSAGLSAMYEERYHRFMKQYRERKGR